MKISKVFIGHGDNSLKVQWGGGGGHLTCLDPTGGSLGCD